jgi:hypothetical protein
MSHPLLGRNHVAEAPSSLRRLHFHKPEAKISLVDHEPKVGVLDQSDLVAQGIHTSEFIPGCATDATELGSCVLNTGTEAFSNILSPAAFAAYVAELGDQAEPANLYTDVVAAERAAIGAYHVVTSQTGIASQEWEPTDCGSSGPYLYQWAKAAGLISDEKIAVGAQNLASLLQTGGVLAGIPWLNSFFEPDALGFVDGDGSVGALQAAIGSGVAGGHEIYLAAIEKVGFDLAGRIDAQKTVIRFRNHWTKGWGDHGSGRFHLSTLVGLGNQADFRQFLAA